MNRKGLPALLTVAAWLSALVPAGWAAQPSASIHLELERSRIPAVVHPTPDPAIAERDAETAGAKIGARERDDEVLRQAIPVPPRRPDLSSDVFSGIQSRHLNDALSRR